MGSLEKFPILYLNTELQIIKRDNRHNIGIIRNFSIKLEPSRQEGSNEVSQCMFSLRNKKNYL